MRIAVADCDDLWEVRQIEDLLVPIHEAIPDFRVTCYAIPNMLGPVHGLKKSYPWVLFAIHGTEHSAFECRSWTVDLAKARLEWAMGMGYEPLFKAPQWSMDSEVEEACLALNVVLHHHHEYVPTVVGLKVYSDRARPEFRALHTHLQPNPSTDDICGNVYFEPQYLKRFDRFDSPFDLYETVPVLVPGISA